MVNTAPSTLPAAEAQADRHFHAMTMAEELCVDVSAVIATLARRLRNAGMPVTPAQCEQYARSLALTSPASHLELYWTTRAVLVKDRQQLEAFDDVFYELFGTVDPSASVQP